ncbi:MAG TPA: hypothetical protein VNA68_00660 [Candidatus Dormibacteraeota bacterium]|nr:hypothetical protein [Candidatus Dormibacteraeota bacterium]
MEEHPTLHFFLGFCCALAQRGVTEIPAGGNIHHQYLMPMLEQVKQWKKEGRPEAEAMWYGKLNLGTCYYPELDENLRAHHAILKYLPSIEAYAIRFTADLAPIIINQRFTEEEQEMYAQLADRYIKMVVVSRQRTERFAT